ncbi:MAG: hypothetical protein H7833_01730 [Magnetococcus sp. DMHC-1]
MPDNPKSETLFPYGSGFSHKTGQGGTSILECDRNKNLLALSDRRNTENAAGDCS